MTRSALAQIRPNDSPFLSGLSTVVDKSTCRLLLYKVVQLPRPGTWTYRALGICS